MGGLGNDKLTGGLGIDAMMGGAGNDVYFVDSLADTVNEEANTDSDDEIRTSVAIAAPVAGVEHYAYSGAAAWTFTGTNADNKLTGGSGVDTLNGGAGNDVLDGGLGADKLTGGTGNDTYIVDNLGDIITETGSDSDDLVKASISYTLSNGLEHLTLLGSALNGTGNSAANTITGNDGANILDGLGGADTLIGGKGADTYIVDDLGDVIDESVSNAAGGGIDLVKSSVSFDLSTKANIENVTLTGLGDINATGNALNNILTGNDGANRLDGGLGNDTLVGGKGGDTYVVDSLTDVVAESITNALGGGIDTIESSLTWSLAALVNVDNLTLTGSANLNGTGNVLDNIITGNDGNNLLDGAAGNDTLIGGLGNDMLTGGLGNDTLKGGAGNDIYIVDSLGDTVNEEANTDSDDEIKTSVAIAAAVTGVEHYTYSGAAAWIFTGTNADNKLTGGSGVDTLNGGAGNDVLDGGLGADKLAGGTGNDTYVVDNLGDVITETGGDSDDLVKASISYTLANGLEHLVLLGSALNGTGNSAANTITGNDGANILDGLGGADTLIGGKGADTYIVDDVNDVVEESVSNAAGGGIDLVKASVSFDLGTRVNIENVTLTGLTDIDATGNALNNILTGNDGANRLDGGLGNDTLVGGKGNDTYVVDSLTDVVTESFTNALGGGIDTIESSITWSLAALTNVDHLTLTGTANINGTGNALDNTITGNSGNNLLDGGAGNDVLVGGLGNDTLTGGLGNDTMKGGTGNDLMQGGAGNDIYEVDSATDIIDEQGNNDSGDLVLSTVTLNLTSVAGGKIEHGTLLGSGDLALIGNSAANILTGNAGNNVLDGGAGNDTLRGGAGNDTYVIDNAADVIDEQGYSDANDEVRSTFTINLAVLANGAIEHAALLGSAAINATGSAAANTIKGNAGTNTLSGLGGDDYLIGSGGDQLLGGEGNDTIEISDSGIALADGGDGFDTLKLDGAGIELDLMTNPGIVQGIELIDLGAFGSNSIILDSAAVATLLPGSERLRIEGDADDVVVLESAFSKFGSEVVDGRTYDVYGNSVDEILVESDVSVEMFVPRIPHTGPIQLGALNGTDGFTVDGGDNGPSSRIHFVSSAGDINGDGFDDFVVQYLYSNKTGYVVFGGAGGMPSHFNPALVDGTNGFKIDSPQGSFRELSHTLSAGDFNGDGIDDLAIGMPFGYTDGIRAGLTYVLFGKSTGFAPTVELTQLDGTNGFRVEGVLDRDFAGASIAMSGDINGDGFDDLVIGAPTAQQPGTRSGSVNVLFGHGGSQASIVELSSLNGTNGFKISGPSNSYLGRDVAILDINGDGLDDVVVGGSPSTKYAFFGHAGSFAASISAESITGAAGIKILGEYGSSTSMSAAGDINGDGYEDFLMGLPHSGAGGVVYVVFGKEGASTLNVASLDGTNGFKIIGANPGDSWITGDWAGRSVSGGGDFNGDGYDDILVGGGGGDITGVGNHSGLSYLVYGSASGFGATLNLSTLSDQQGFKIAGAAAGDWSGMSASFAGDLNGDGFSDLILSGPYADPSAGNTSAAYVIYGGDYRVETTKIGNSLDNSLSGNGGVNILMGAQGDDILWGNGGKDTLNGGEGDDHLHVGNREVFRVDGGNGVDTLHLDFAGVIDFGNLDNNAATSDRGRFTSIEIIDVNNGFANGLKLHLSDILDMEVQASNVGGNVSLDNALRIEGDVGDSLQLFASDGWTALGSQQLANYNAYKHLGVTILVDQDMTVTIS